MLIVISVGSSVMGHAEGTDEKVVYMSFVSIQNHPGISGRVGGRSGVYCGAKVSPWVRNKVLLEFVVTPRGLGFESLVRSRVCLEINLTNGGQTPRGTFLFFPFTFCPRHLQGDVQDRTGKNYDSRKDRWDQRCARNVRVKHAICSGKR